MVNDRKKSDAWKIKPCHYPALCKGKAPQVSHPYPSFQVPATGFGNLLLQRPQERQKGLGIFRKTPDGESRFEKVVPVSSR